MVSSFRRRDGREHFVIGHGEIVVAHQRVGRRVFAVVRVRQVAVAVHVCVAIVGYQQVGAGPEYRTYPVKTYVIYCNKIIIVPY